MEKFVTNCIYCNSNAKLYKEHIFGAWHREIPSLSKNPSHRVSLKSRKNSAIIKIDRFNRAEALGSHQLRIACYECNRGWMDDIQTLAKPIALNIAKPMNINIDNADVFPLANWVTLVAMSAEFADLSSQVIPMADRRFLKDNGRPPKNHYVFLACTEPGGPAMGYWHRSLEMAEDGNDCYIQSTVFNLANVSIIHLSGNIKKLPFLINMWKNSRLSQVWPDDNLISIPLSFADPYPHYNLPALEFWQVAAGVLDIPRLSGPTL